MSVALLLMFAPRTSFGQPRDAIEPALATISGAVLDPGGAAIAGAQVALTVIPGAPLQRATSGREGQFTFTGVSPGAYMVVVHSPGFEAFATSAFTVSMQRFRASFNRLKSPS